MTDWWIPFAVIGAVVVVGLYLRRQTAARSIWHRPPLPPSDPAAASAAVPTEAQIVAALRCGDLPTMPKGWRAFRLGVAGESRKNADGRRRQDIIRRLSVGDRIRLECEPENRHDNLAVRVVSDYGQIGYLPRGHRCEEDVADGRLWAFVAAINGDGRQKRGVVLALIRKFKPRAKRVKAVVSD